MEAISDEAALRAIYPEPVDLIRRKVRSELDHHARRLLEISPLAFLSTSGRDGHCDVSPRGDRPGFIQALDARRLAIPDWPGNNRVDSLRNIIANPFIGMLIVVPGHDDTLRINGSAFVTTDAALLETMRTDRRPPRSAIVIDIEEVFFHCGRAFRRSDAWNPQSYPPAGTLPTLAKILAEQTNPDAIESDLLARSDQAPLY